MIAENLRKQCGILRFDEKITGDLILNTNTTTTDLYDYDSTNAFANYDENTRINTGSSHIFIELRFGLKEAYKF